MPQIPAHIFWPGFIISLLLFSITWSMTILMVAQADGGPQIIPDYYQRSVNFDEEQATRDKARKLGWTLDVDMDGPIAELHIVDAGGEAVKDIEGIVGFGRPSLATKMESARLTADEERPGVYLFTNLAETPGLWDLGVVVDKSEKTYHWTLRVTVK